ncbi:mycothiol acetyltransferase [Anaerotignum neopropionicum]|uniref:Mycothiol acetyltransferase n=1 Tax=Anaerotignum neopropionicum TaxID=36847 RepID=A0A136WG37_9FIRM|nr:GNAT family N-acetyltransferase [Anaerotignum neopropionicum]KXL53427.1 mycothiol acetyltransferase [Anaerotignum neopropionicum]
MLKKMIDGQAFWREIAKRLSNGESTNFFFSQEDALLMVQRDKIYRLDFDGGVYFFVKEETFYQLYYFLEKEKSPEVLPALAEPIILEEVLLAAKERIPSEDNWKKAGLKPYLERKRMYLTTKNVSFEERKITFASEKMLDDIFYLMHESFEPFSSALPTKESLLTDILNQKVLVSLQNQELLGFLHFGNMKQGSMLWHIAVMPQARGLGVGNRLVKDWIFAQRDVAKKFLLWVRTDNPPALRMYEKFGFLPDGRVAPVMIKTT